MSKYLNLEEKIFRGAGKYDIPEILPTYKINCDDWIGFNYVKTLDQNKEKKGVTFFIDDYQFERCWNYPNRYGQVLFDYNLALSPDFSQYYDFPKAVSIYNHYRKHWLARYWQEMGVTVIPTIAWSDETSFDWCFDGEPRKSIVAVSNVGCMKSKKSRYLFRVGYEKMLEILLPKEILFFGHTFENYPGNIRYIRYKHFAENSGGN